jgi:hypothetical protein
MKLFIVSTMKRKEILNYYCFDVALYEGSMCLFHVEVSGLTT